MLLPRRHFLRGLRVQPSAMALGLTTVGEDVTRPNDSKADSGRRLLEDRAGHFPSLLDFVPPEYWSAIRSRTLPAATNLSPYLQAGLDTGRSIWVPEGVYPCAGLVLRQPGQRLIGAGSLKSTFVRATDGPVLTLAGRGCGLLGIEVRNESETTARLGDNIVVTGPGCLIFDTMSRWSLGRALYGPSASHLTISSCLMTTSTPETGAPVIELGSDSAIDYLYYVQITDLLMTQKERCLLIRNPGACMVKGGQLGGIQFVTAKGAGARPRSGGSRVAECRILGDVLVEGSGHGFVNNAAGAINVTFAPGSNRCVWRDNVEDGSGFALADHGVDNLVERIVAGAGLAATKLGADSSRAVLGWDLAAGRAHFPGPIRLLNGESVEFLGPERTVGGHASVTSANVLTIVAQGTLDLAPGAGQPTRFYEAGLVIPTLGAAPPAPVEGQLVCADDENWAPAGKVGRRHCVQFLGGAWRRVDE
jgi:hypothetical protein